MQATHRELLLECLDQGKASGDSSKMDRIVDGKRIKTDFANTKIDVR